MSAPFQLTGKQVIVVRRDLVLSPGKLAAQVAHASVLATLAAPAVEVARWMHGGGLKVVVTVADEAALRALWYDALGRGLTAKLVEDAGRTEVEPGTTTALAIGPAMAERVSALTRGLELL